MSVLRRFRDSITGRFTTRADAEARPAGTVGEGPSEDAARVARVEALARASTTGMVSTTAVLDALDSREQ